MADWGGQLDTLVRERGKALLRYAYLLTGEQGAAEELVQDALVAVLSRSGRLRDPGAVEGYVRRTILTRYVDGYRRRRRWTGVRHLLAAPDRVDGPSTAVEGRADVVAALRVLGPRVRACIVLRYYEDLSVAETAEQLGISDGAVKRYTSDGIHALQKLLGPLAPTDDDIAPIATVTSIAHRATPNDLARASAPESERSAR